MRKMICVAILCLSLTSCGGQTVVVASDRPALDLSPTPIELSDVQFRSVGKESINREWDKLEDAGDTPVLFILTPDDYKKMSQNMLRIQSFITESQTILRQYKRYYEGE